jgi:EF-hand domain pair/EF hand
MRPLSFTTALLLAAFATAAQAQSQNQENRFRGMDRDGDGVITKTEWRGNARAFEQHDWNGDGVLSGVEVRPGAQRPSKSRDGGQYVQDSRNGEFNDWTESRFDALDRNNDNRLSRSEWLFDLDTFRRVDRSGDGTLSRREFLGFDTAIDHEDPFSETGDLFAQIDVNRDGRISRDEWQWDRASFDRRDRNRDGWITRDESSRSGATSDNPTYRQGHQRGLTDGRQAGKEDAERRTWDLDGQRELEQADAGYRPELGDRSAYQAGYRAGFTVGYREGFGR